MALKSRLAMWLWTREIHETRRSMFHLWVSCSHRSTTDSRASGSRVRRSPSSVEREDLEIISKSPYVWIVRTVSTSYVRVHRTHVRTCTLFQKPIRPTIDCPLRVEAWGVVAYCSLTLFQLLFVVTTASATTSSSTSSWYFNLQHLNSWYFIVK